MNTPNDLAARCAAYNESYGTEYTPDMYDHARLLGGRVTQFDEGWQCAASLVYDHIPDGYKVAKDTVPEQVMLMREGLCAMQSDRESMRKEIAILRWALEKVQSHGPIMGSTGEYRQGQLDILENVATIAGMARTEADNLHQ